MKHYKIESFIYLCFFLAALAFYGNVEIEQELEEKLHATELAKSNFEDAATDISIIEMTADDTLK